MRKRFMFCTLRQYKRFTIFQHIAIALLGLKVIKIPDYYNIENKIDIWCYITSVKLMENNYGWFFFTSNPERLNFSIDRTVSSFWHIRRIISICNKEPIDIAKYEAKATERSKF